MRSKVSRVQERGQIAVLGTFTIIVLLGFAALAIDGSMLYVQRRMAQNAADTASMAAVLAMSQGYSGAQIKYIAMEKAKKNGFDNADPQTEVIVNWPPKSPNTYAGNANYIQVFITGTVDSAFAHFVYNGPLQVTVEAVAHARLEEDFAPGYAIFGASLDACRTLRFDGTPTLGLTGGGSIVSNSLASCGCDSSGGSGVKDGSAQIAVYEGGNILISGCWQQNGGSGSVAPIPITGLPQQSLPEAPIPDCAGMTDFGEVKINNSGGIAAPGLYESLSFTSQAVATMQAGMYCIYGMNDSGWGFQTVGQANLVGDGIMIYLTENAGGFSSSGGTQIYINASDSLQDASGNEWAGMLIYSHPLNTNELILTGTSDSWYVGSIYAYSSPCTAAGTDGGVALQTQLICDTIRITGTGDILVDYDMAKNYHLPDAVELTN
ncbi:MAG: hypothetical protein IIC78_13000 [Chloroflexi bacterium]|nr:hypothetical protein [Chloroflexota bacterium]